MPAQWTAEIIGEMHLLSVTGRELANRVGWNPGYLSMVLNGHKEPKGAEKKLRDAIESIKAEREE